MQAFCKLMLLAFLWIPNVFGAGTSKRAIDDQRAVKDYQQVYEDYLSTFRFMNNSIHQHGSVNRSIIASVKDVITGLIDSLEKNSQGKSEAWKKAVTAVIPPDEINSIVGMPLSNDFGKKSKQLVEDILSGKQTPPLSPEMQAIQRPQEEAAKKAQELGSTFDLNNDDPITYMPFALLIAQKFGLATQEDEAPDLTKRKEALQKAQTAGKNYFLAAIPAGKIVNFFDADALGNYFNSPEGKLKNPLNQQPVATLYVFKFSPELLTSGTTKQFPFVFVDSWGEEAISEWTIQDFKLQLKKQI